MEKALSASIKRSRYTFLHLPLSISLCAQLTTEVNEQSTRSMLLTRYLFIKAYQHMGNMIKLPVLCTITFLSPHIKQQTYRAVNAKKTHYLLLYSIALTSRFALTHQFFKTLCKHLKLRARVRYLTYYKYANTRVNMTGILASHDLNYKVEGLKL